MAVKTASRRLCDAVHDWRSSREGLHLCRMMQALVSLTAEFDEHGRLLQRNEATSHRVTNQRLQRNPAAPHGSKRIPA